MRQELPLSPFPDERLRQGELSALSCLRHGSSCVSVCFCLSSSNTVEKWILWKAWVCRTGTGCAGPVWNAGSKVWEFTQNITGDGRQGGVVSLEFYWPQVTPGSPHASWVPSTTSIVPSVQMASHLSPLMRLKAWLASYPLDTFPWSSPSSSVGPNSISCFSPAVTSPFMAWISDSLWTPPPTPSNMHGSQSELSELIASQKHLV